MPYITRKNLDKIDKLMSTAVTNCLTRIDMNKDEANELMQDFAECLTIITHLHREQKEQAEQAKVRMRKYRNANPEKYKNYMKEYMKEYTAGIRRRKREIKED